MSNYDSMPVGDMVSVPVVFHDLSGNHAALVTGQETDDNGNPTETLHLVVFTGQGLLPTNQRSVPYSTSEHRSWHHIGESWYGGEEGETETAEVPEDRQLSERSADSEQTSVPAVPAQKSQKAAAKRVNK